MTQRNILKLLIFLISTQFCVVKAYGQAEAGQSIISTVQQAVAITKEATSIEKATVNPANGTHTGLTVKFTLDTNLPDDQCDFLIKSTMNSETEQVSAFGEGSILFGHTIVKPTIDAINDAKAGGHSNKNVIAYPLKVTVAEPLTVNAPIGQGVNDDAYAIKLNGNKGKETITIEVLRNPIAGTYHIGQDQAGAYQTVVTFTAVPKN